MSDQITLILEAAPDEDPAEFQQALREFVAGLQAAGFYTEVTESGQAIVKQRVPS
jgi:hypothetical protein